MNTLRIFLLVVIAAAPSNAQAQSISNTISWIQDRILCPIFDVCNKDPAHVACTTSECVTQKYIENGLVPDVFQIAPKEMMRLEYGSKVVTLGTNMTIAETAYSPTVISWTTVPFALYTLIFSDPDVPSEQDNSGRSYRHWLVTNIPGTDIARGTTIRPYVGPGAAPNSGVHRYNFLVYQQNGRITATDASDGYYGPDKVRTFQIVDFTYLNDPYTAAQVKDNIHWSPERFALRWRLGAPIAGNFFRTSVTA